MDAKRTVEELHLKYCEESFDKEGILSGFEVDAPETFNFAYDVVRKIAEIEPDRRAMLWCDERDITTRDSSLDELLASAGTRISRYQMTSFLFYLCTYELDMDS